MIKITELHMQIHIAEILRRHFEKVEIEKATLSGSTDIMITHQDEYYAIELKLKPNKVVFDQLENNKLTAHYLIAITFKPSRQSTIDKWQRYAKNKNMNLVWVEDLIGFNGFKNLVSNPDYNHKYMIMVNKKFDWNKLKKEIND